MCCCLLLCSFIGKNRSFIICCRFSFYKCNRSCRTLWQAITNTITVTNGPCIITVTNAAPEQTPSDQIETPIDSVEITGAQLSPGELVGIIISLIVVAGVVYFLVKKFGGSKPVTVVAWPAGPNAIKMEPRQKGRGR